MKPADGSKNVSGFLHGAYDEGQKMATALVECIQTPDTCDDAVHFEQVKGAGPYVRNDDGDVA
jgi:hypothetical protein